MNLVPFEPEHLIQIDLEGVDRVIADNANPENWAGKALTIFENGMPLAAFGLAVDDGVGTVWALIGRTLKTKRFALHRVVKRSIPRVMDHFELKAIEARAFGPHNRAWLRRLGFEGDGDRMRLFT